MTHFAIRQQTGDRTVDEVARLAATARDDGGELLSAYWTPQQRQLLSIFHGDSATVGPSAVPETFPVLPITAEEYGPRAMEPAAGEGDGLRLVLVRRKLDPMTQREFRAVALQAIMCAYEYTDMRWLRSFWATEQNELHCLFRTRTHDLVREHAQRSRIPCDEIYDAIEVTPGQVFVTDVISQDA